LTGNSDVEPVLTKPMNLHLYTLVS